MEQKWAGDPFFGLFAFSGLQRSRHTLDHRSAFANYDCLTISLKSVVRTLKATAAESFGGKPYNIAPHFLGGAVCFCLAADGEPVEQIFTMSSPFGGNRSTSVLFIAFWYTLVLADVSLFGNTVRGLLKSKINIPVWSVVSVWCEQSRQITFLNRVQLEKRGF